MSSFFGFNMLLVISQKCLVVKNIYIYIFFVAVYVDYCDKKMQKWQILMNVYRSSVIKFWILADIHKCNDKCPKCIIFYHFVSDFREHLIIFKYIVNSECLKMSIEQFYQWTCNKFLVYCEDTHLATFSYWVYDWHRWSAVRFCDHTSWFNLCEVENWWENIVMSQLVEVHIDHFMQVGFEMADNVWELGTVGGHLCPASKHQLVEVFGAVFRSFQTLTGKEKREKLMVGNRRIRESTYC